jgi:hypothetical protein
MAMMRSCRLHRVCLLLCLACAPLLQAQTAQEAPDVPTPGEAEQLLETIRQVLVEAAVDDTVTVVSSAYIDASGRLIESSYFDTETVVRGVRVLDYLPQDTAVPDPAERLPASLAGLRDGVCALAPERHYAPTVMVSAQVALGQGRLNDAHGAALIAQTARAIDASVARSAAWVAVHEDLRLTQANAYERLVSGLRAFGPTDYALRWTLTEAPSAALTPAQRLRQGLEIVSSSGRALLAANPLVPVDLAARTPQVVALFHIELVDLSRDQVLSSLTHGVPLWSGTPALVARADDLAVLEADLQRQIDDFLGAVQIDHQCSLRQFALQPSPQDPAHYALRLGTQNGARPGDRFLLVEAPWSGPEDTLNGDLVATMAIAEIVALGPYESTLAIVAGPSTPGAPRMAIAF